MKKFRTVFYFLFLLVFTLSCNFPLLANSGINETENWMAVLSKVETLGGLERIDPDSDGAAEQLAYSLPEELIGPDLYMQQTYVADVVDDKSGFYQSMSVTLRNESDTEQYVEAVIEIPKEFAADISELTFSMEPLEVINPDPSSRFGFVVPARTALKDALKVQGPAYIIYPASDPEKAFMWVVLSSAVSSCDKQMSANEAENKELQAICYIRFVTNFQGFAEPEDLGIYCGRAPGEWAGVCSALVYSDPEYCKKISDKDTNSICTGLLIKQLCRNIPLETRGLCYAEGAQQLNSIGGCMIVPDEDIRNDCLAKVKKDPDYCNNIIDEELKSQCIAMVKKDKNVIGELLAQSSGSSGEIFSSSEAEATCQRFTSLSSSYLLIKHQGTGDVLSCYYGDDKDRENDAYTWKYLLYIKQYPGVPEAMQDWQTLDNPDSAAFKMGINELLMEKSYHTDSAYLYLEKNAYSYQGQDYLSYTLHAGALVTKYRIEYVENGVPNSGESRWNSVLNEIKQVIE